MSIASNVIGVRQPSLSKILFLHARSEVPAKSPSVLWFIRDPSLSRPLHPSHVCPGVRSPSMYNPPRRTVNNALRSRRRVSSARHGVALGRPVRWASSMQASVIARAGAGAYLCVVLGGNAVPSVAKSASLPWLGEKKPEVELMGLSFFFAPTVPGRQLCGLCCRVEEVAQRQAHQRSAAKWLRVVKMTSCCAHFKLCVYSTFSQTRLRV